MIEIAEDEETEILHLVVNGVRCEDPVGVLPMRLSGHDGGNGFFLHPPTEAVAQLLLQHHFSEFPQGPWTLELRSHQDVTQPLTAVDAEIFHPFTVFRTNQGRLYSAFSTDFVTHDWKRLWSISEYKSAFDEIVKQQGLRTALPFTEGIVLPPFPESPNHKFLLEVTNSDRTVEQDIREQKSLIEHLHALTRAHLQSRLKSESLVLRFDFPEETKTACEQYLLYFVQFLADVGVKATAELQHDAGQVLFTVTPESKDEALDKIRAALDLYLKIPLGNLGGDEVDISTQRLASNVYHLRSQLALAQAVIQAKDATIQAQQAALSQQQYLLTNSVVADSLVESSTPRPKDTETVLDGLAEITKYEGKGFNINLPEIFRRLREFFQKD